MTKTMAPLTVAPVGENGVKPATQALTTTTELIDEVKAYDYLQTMDRSVHSNRAVSDRVVQEYAAAMRRGEWLPTNQAIGFDRNGVLRDGQHRLWAVITAAVAVEMQVCRGLDPAAFDVIDTGKRRTPADVLHIHGETNTNDLQAALAWLYRFLHNLQVGSAAANQISTQQRLALLEAHPGIRQSVRVRLGYSRQARRMLPSGLMGCLAYLLYEASPQNAQQFFEDLRTGVGLEADDPVKLLRDRLLTNVGSTRKIPHGEVAALCVKAWNLRAGGQRRSVLSWRITEPFPDIAGLDARTLTATREEVR